MEIRPIDNSLNGTATEVGAISPATPERGSAGRGETRPKGAAAAGNIQDRVTISPEAARKSQDERQKQQTEEMKSTEEKVRAHEAAHMAAGGQLAGGASYQYRTGPDGKSYITGGEVQIDMSTGRTPQETIRNMEQVIRAALAPADPSPQDRAVAAQAAALLAEAQQQLLKGPEKNPAAQENAFETPEAGTAAGNLPGPKGGTVAAGSSIEPDTRLSQPFSIFA